jgi:uncharacterized membrane protein (UPF0127 family)
MELYPIDINGHKLRVALANTEEERYVGLSEVESIGPSRGMLFMFPTPIRMSMVMRDMNMALSFVFLNDMWEVIHVDHREEDDLSGVFPPTPAMMVLELEESALERFDIKVGDSVSADEYLMSSLTGMEMYKDGGKFTVKKGKVYEVTEDDIKTDPDKAQILNTKGEVVANIATGARIFSRVDTKLLIKKAKEGGTDLVDHMIGIIDKQNKQKKQFVDS